MLWYSLEAPRRSASNNYPQHEFLWRNKKINIRIPPLKRRYRSFVSIVIGLFAFGEGSELQKVLQIQQLYSKSFFCLFV